MIFDAQMLLSATATWSKDCLKIYDILCMVNLTSRRYNFLSTVSLRLIKRILSVYGQLKFNQIRNTSMYNTGAVITPLSY